MQSAHLAQCKFDLFGAAIDVIRRSGLRSVDHVNRLRVDRFELQVLKSKTLAVPLDQTMQVRVLRVLDYPDGVPREICVAPDWQPPQLVILLQVVQDERVQDRRLCNDRALTSLSVHQVLHLLLLSSRSQIFDNLTAIPSHYFYLFVLC